VSLGQNRSAALSLVLSTEAAAKAQNMRWLEGASACSLQRPSARDEMTGVDGAAQAGDVDEGIGEGVETRRAVVDRDVGAQGGTAAHLETGGVMGKKGGGAEFRADWGCPGSMDRLVSRLTNRVLFLRVPNQGDALIAGLDGASPGFRCR
jgi:hypothetical protein